MLKRRAPLIEIAGTSPAMTKSVAFPGGGTTAALPGKMRSAQSSGSTLTMALP
jgi:hypothetical protein